MKIDIFGALSKATVSDGNFFNLFLNLFVFFWEKSYHSNLAITSIPDYEWPNGFQRKIE